MSASFRLGHIGGLEIGIHYSWPFALVFITWSLADGFFPANYRGWTTATYWTTGALAALLLFASVLVHELAHSFVARARGLPVQGITLFIFGGVSNLQAEPRKARDEFAIAIVGPLASLLLGGLFAGLWVLLSGQGRPLEATLFYLALGNVLLGIFNLVPGFPLDGGRVLRSVVWGVTGSARKATNIATIVGQVVGYLLIGLGVLQALYVDVLSGLWVALIGWFLSTAASSSRRQVPMEQAVHDLPVRAVMDAAPQWIVPHVTVDALVSDHFLRRGVRACPVVEGGRLVGIVSLTDVKETAQERWPLVTVGDIMTRDPLVQVSPDADLSEALRLLGERSLNQVLVTQDGRLVGLVSREHIIHYLQRQPEPGVGSDSPA